jgi:hypothetical protein
MATLRLGLALLCRSSASYVVLKAPSPTRLIILKRALRWYSSWGSTNDPSSAVLKEADAAVANADEDDDALLLFPPSRSISDSAIRLYSTLSPPVRYSSLFTPVREDCRLITRFGPGGWNGPFSANIAPHTPREPRTQPVRRFVHAK